MTDALASDAMEGREAGTPGYDRAAALVAKDFGEAGLKPHPVLGGWFQPVRLQTRTLVPGSVEVKLVTPTGEQELTNGVHIALDASPDEAAQSIKADIVFVGFGVEAPSLGHDDYAGLDVKGRVVALLEGAPATFPSTLRAHYGWPEQKELLAARHGAVGIVTIKPPARERIAPWERTRLLKPGPQLTWARPDGRGHVAAPQVRFNATISTDSAANLFGSAVERDRIFAEAEQGTPKGFPLRAALTMRRQSHWEERASANVVGFLPGRDPTLQEELVVVMGHLDGLGIGKPINGDAIYNGASDNAVGVAAIVEIARLLAQGPAPRRSILFVALTGEEKGLLGSEYFARFPPVPVDRIAAVVNIDGLPAFRDVGGVIAYGAEHSTLGRVVQKAAKATGFAVEPDAAPEQGIFTRSDHYSLVKAGVPALFILPGYGPNRDGTRGRDMWDWFFANRYHRPEDDMQLPWNWSAVGRLTDLHHLIVRDIANDPKRPRWNDGDLFGSLYSGARKRASLTARQEEQ